MNFEGGYFNKLRLGENGALSKGSLYKFAVFDN